MMKEERHKGIFKLIDKTDLFNEKLMDGLFEYSDEEIKDFHQSFENIGIPLKDIYESVSEGMSLIPKVDKINNIVELIKTLSNSDLDKLEENINNFNSSNPNFVWNMLTKADQILYKDEYNFYDWISSLPADKLDYYILRAADGKRLHDDEFYIKPKSTTVEIIDGYLAISSSNLEILDKFLKRIQVSVDTDYEHRIKKHGEVTIHSYVFNMNK